MTIGGERWRIDCRKPVELAISVDFRGDQPRAFGLPQAAATVVDAGDFVGDTRRGGSVNCETFSVTPHGNGTHTEGVGHISRERISVADAVAEPVLPAALLSVAPRRLEETDESYDGTSAADDRVVCRADLQRALEHAQIDDDFCRAVVVRVDSFEPRADHTGNNPPYLTNEAVDWLRGVGCDHLLLELPSVDREVDGGTVPNHHRFFGLGADEEVSEASRRRTITEMICVSSDIDDGSYALSLRFPRLETDAVPSRPVLYAIEQVDSRSETSDE